MALGWLQIWTEVKVFLRLIPRYRYVLIQVTKTLILPIYCLELCMFVYPFIENWGVITGQGWKQMMGGLRILKVNTLGF